MQRLSKKPNAVRMRALYRKRRHELFRLLGGDDPRCVDCGTDCGLEPDHIQPREWQPREFWSGLRMRTYIREAMEGKLVLRCRGCNARKGQPVAVGTKGDEF